jgi:hypothetical protein
MKIYNYQEFITESLPRQHSVEQLERVRKLSKSTDIGDKTIETGANLLSHSNPIDDGIESYEDYMKHDKETFYKTPDFDEKNPLNNQKKLPTQYIGPQMKSRYEHEPQHMKNKNKKK